MAPPLRYPRPAEQLSALLAESRRRHEPFEVAWERAVRPDGPQIMASDRNPPKGAVLWPSDGSTRHLERLAVTATRDAWRRAYERRPATRRERALSVLLPLLSELAAATDAPDEHRVLSRAA